MIELTGNYRIIKIVLGSKPKEISSGTKAEMQEELKSLYKDSIYTLQEEVFTKNSIKDKNGKYLNSDPYWRNSE